MNRIVSSLLLVACVILSLAACSSGAYVANPTSNGNSSVNPLNPLKASDFNWPASTHIVSLNFNGTPWYADTFVSLAYVDTLQTNVLVATNAGKTLALYIQYGWSNNLYNMGFKQYNNLAYWMPDSVSAYYPYSSALGNSGELYMTANDTVNFDGKFYFQAINSKGDIINISNGTFNYHR